ncbi:MAG: GlxA family transcriptional regulator [Alphaproteobacteria bacterium]
MATPTHVSFVLIPRFNMLTATTLIEPMRIANYLVPRLLYAWDFRSPEPGAVTASNGLAIECASLDAHDAPRPDIILVCGSWGAEHYQSPALFNWLRRCERRGATLVGVELGVYALARAGLLAGRPATTHWSCRPGFTEAYPDVDVSEQLFTVDGNLMTCAGGVAGLDLMLHILAARQGDQLATEVANQIVHAPRRPPEAAQRQAPGGAQDRIHPGVRDAMSLLEARVEDPIAIPQLCETLGMSQRQLERLFRRDTGCTIVQFGKLLRLQYARVLLASTDMSVREVSASCGFDSMSYFSACFRRTFGRKPSAYRRMWPENEPAPSWPGTVYAHLQNVVATDAGAKRRLGGELRRRP